MTMSHSPARIRRLHAATGLRREAAARKTIRTEAREVFYAKRLAVIKVAPGYGDDHEREAGCAKDEDAEVRP